MREGRIHQLFIQSSSSVRGSYYGPSRTPTSTSGGELEGEDEAVDWPKPPSSTLAAPSILDFLSPLMVLLPPMRFEEPRSRATCKSPPWSSSLSSSESLARRFELLDWDASI